MSESRYDQEVLPRYPAIGWGTERWQRQAVLPEYELSARVAMAMDSESDREWTERDERIEAVTARCYEAMQTALEAEIERFKAMLAEVA